MAETNDKTAEPKPAEAPDKGQPLSWPLLRRLRRYFAKRGADEGELDDLVQDVFLRMARGGRAPAADGLDGYIVQTANSVMIDRWRAQRARRSQSHVPFDPEAHGQAGPGAEDALLAREGLRQGGLILMELPERCRHVFMLRRVEGLSFAEIARRLNISLSTAEKDMLQAVRHLAMRLEDLG